MFPFGKKRTIGNRKYENIGRKLEIDIHSHIVPGIDDGSSNLEESMRMISSLRAIGYKTLITTPHVMYEGYSNSKDSILEKFDILREEVERRGLEIALEIAAEYYMDEGLQNLLRQKEILTVGDAHILFETAYISMPNNFESMIYLMRMKGYTPIIAHPERYLYIKEPEVIYERWKELGIEFQVNLNSFTGYYGNLALQRAKWLAKMRMIDYLGSDLHDMQQFEAIKKGIWRVDMKEVIDSNPIKNIKVLQS